MDFTSISNQFGGLWRWRETLLGLFIAMCGMILAVGASGIMAMLGTCVSVIGAVVTFAGVQRSRFRTSGSDGTGIVQIDDQMVTFYGPHDGGAVTIAALEYVQLDPTQKPAAWIVQEVGGPPLTIPTNAQGAELLFNVFSTLQGIKTENISAKLRANPSEPILVWHETERRLH